MTDGIQTLKVRRKHALLIGFILTILTFVLAIYFVSCGTIKLGFLNSWNIIIAKCNSLLFNNSAVLETYKSNYIAVVFNIRLPRILTSIFIGFGLATAGCMFQALLKNPLADPYTIGVSTGAAFGASLAIYANIAYGFLISPTGFAFISALITLLLVIFIASKGGGLYSSNLIIAGIIVSSILSSGLSFIKMLAGDNVSAIIFWLMGSLSSCNWNDVFILIPTIIICSVIGIIFANDLNIIMLGEQNAKALGVNTTLIRYIYLIIGALITAVCVSISGIIGFVGLVIPHILRYKITNNNRILIPLSGLMGGIILMLADNITRLLFISEIPVGVLTTLIGGPFFIYVFTSRKGH